MKFAHTHAHSDYSLMDAVASVPEIVKYHKDNGMRYACLTDHGTASGWYAFWKECKEQGVLPVLGIESYVSVSSEEDEKSDKTYHHLVMIVKDDIGYKQLCQLIHNSHYQHFYYKPRMPLSEVLQICSGNHIIISTACIGGILNKMILNNNIDSMIATVSRLKECFGNDFFLEVQMNELPEQKTCNTIMLDVSKKFNVPIVLTNDCHYIDKSDVVLQDFLYMLRSKSTISSPKITPGVREANYCSYEDFLEKNTKWEYGYSTKQIDEWLDNTNRIVEQCAFDFDVDSLKFPKYNSERPSDDLLRDLAKQRLEKKKLNDKPEYVERLQYELDTLKSKGYSDYFLVFHDIYQYAKTQGIWSAPGRGSAAGSLVSYLLGITKLDPIKYNMMFERFLDPSPDAKQLPDIDTDWDSERRNEIISYCETRWGKQNMCGVGTISRFHLRGIIRDAARVLEIPLSDTNDFVQSLEDDLPKRFKTPDDYFQELLQKGSSQIKKWTNDASRKKVLYIAQRMYKHIRHRSQHAAGIIILSEPIHHHIPVDSVGDAEDKKSRAIISAFSGGQEDKQIEELKILKLDILGVNTISILKGVVDLVKQTQSKDITKDLLDINLQDKKLYSKIMDGRNIGVFQFESSSINKLLKAVAPKTFQDVIAVNALHRPGQIDFAYKYAKREMDVPPHPIISEITHHTRGVIIYQEQLMQTIARFMNVSLGATNKYRKLLGGKDIDADNPLNSSNKKVKEFVKEFYKKTSKAHPDLSMQQIAIILKYIMNYAGYGFNYSHALCYAYIAMQTLWCKVYYPAEFYCAALNHSDNAEDYKKYLEDAQYNSIEILPISFHDSKYIFTVEDESHIRCGFKMLKGFGEIAYNEMQSVDLSQFKDIVDVLVYPWSKFNKTSISAVNSVNGFKDQYSFKQKFIAMNVLTAYDKTKIKKGRIDKVRDKIIFAMTSDNADPLTQLQIRKLAEEYIGWDYYAMLQNNVLASRMKNIYNAIKHGGLPTFDDFSETRPNVCAIMTSSERKTTKNHKEYIVATLTDGRSIHKVKIWKWSIKNPPLAYCLDTFEELATGNMALYELEYDEQFGFTAQKVKVKRKKQ